jgi:hypothetical protein
MIILIHLLAFVVLSGAAERLASDRKYKLAARVAELTPRERLLQQMLRANQRRFVPDDTDVDDDDDDDVAAHDGADGGSDDRSASSSEEDSSDSEFDQDFVPHEITPRQDSEVIGVVIFIVAIAFCIICFGRRSNYMLLGQ